MSVPIFTPEENMAGSLVSALAFTILGNLHSLALEDIGVSDFTSLAAWLWGHRRPLDSDKKKTDRREEDVC